MVTSMHTHTCGELTSSDVNAHVVLTGWVWHRRDLGGLIFIDIRDKDGYTQIAIDPACCSEETYACTQKLRSEWCVQIAGTVRLRPADQQKTSSTTGCIEVLASDITVFNASPTPPFQIEDKIDLSEDMYLTYRYLDIRRPRTVQTLQKRSDYTFAIRQAFHNHAFMEVETPALFKSTPEGARDFLVPSRIKKGAFYALPQSPQLLKQLLMIGGVERYYQVAKCFRDEDFRADRQPEFTQVDMEMSFVTEDDILHTLEQILHEAFAQVGVDMPIPLPRMQYWDAMDTYGSDKPDTRFGMEIHNLTSGFTSSEFSLFASAEKENKRICCICAKGAGNWGRSRIDKLQDVAKKEGAKGLAWIAFTDAGDIKGSIAKFMSQDEITYLMREMNAAAGDLLLFCVDTRLVADEVMGALRLHMADALGITRSGHAFLWVVNFPLFHWDDERGAYAAEHQPFTLPRCESVEEIKANPLGIGSYTYDFVMDGYEAGGGGMRIHDPKMQLDILELLGFTPERARAQFGFLLDALQYGAPPMGGFALGLDRVCMLICGTESIREVIAFPKSTSGSDLMSAAPASVSEAQLRDLHLRIDK